MEYFNSFRKLVENFESLPYPGRIYFGKKSCDSTQESEYWVLSSNEIKNQDMIKTQSGMLIPEELMKFDVSDYMSVGTFQDIIYNVLENNPEISVSDTQFISEAIDYYLEYDDFKY